MPWFLAWRMFLREWRGGEIRLLLAALALGVALVTGIALFAERLQAALVGEASVYLGADQVLQSPEPVSGQWLDQASAAGLQWAMTAVFPTMAYPADPAATSDRMVLVSLKAVTPNYPLRGELEIRRADQSVQSVRHGPPPGGAWVDRHILTQLDIAVGSSIAVGEQAFVVDAELLREGDAGSSFYGMGSRVMIAESDLAATRLLLPGSRVEYRYLLAGSGPALAGFRASVRDSLLQGQRWITLEDNQPGIAGALDKAALFLLLAGSLGVLLSALACAFAARRYCDRHVDVVAVLKTLGAGRREVLGLLCGQMLLVWLLATLAGFILGGGLHLAFLAVLADWLPPALPPAGVRPFLSGALTGGVCLVAFVIPPFVYLQRVPPWFVLRSDRTLHNRQWRGWLVGLAGVAFLIGFYSQHWRLALAVMAGLLLVLLLAGGLGMVLMQLGRVAGRRAGRLVRLGIANVQRRQGLSLLQVVVFGIGFMLLAVMTLLRTSLLAEWRMQVPVDAPNVFLINIARQDVAPLQAGLQSIGIPVAATYPMVRGRLARVNGQVATEVFDRSVSEVYRELNLSWSAALPDHNEIMAGDWAMPLVAGQAVPVSIEQGLARRLRVKPGDLLEFTIAGQAIPAYVDNIRQLDWDRMTPNFYFLFPPGVLESYHATWMTSVHRSEAQERDFAHLMRQFPAVTAYPVDDLIRRIQSIVERASLAVEVILVLVLLAGILVMLACLRASLDQRLHESALLRTMGAGRQLILGSLAIEFVFIGGCAGLLAAGGAEAMAWMLQEKLFRMEAALHPGMWLVMPGLAALSLGLAGTLFCLPVVRVPPARILRLSLD